jgi:hypothetical protein
VRGRGDIAWKWIFGSALVAGLAGCASKPVSGAAPSDLRETYLKDSEEKLRDFDRASQEKRDAVRRVRFSRPALRWRSLRELDLIAIKLAQAHQDLHELRVAGVTSWDRFRARLEVGLADVGRSLQNAGVK